MKQSISQSLLCRDLISFRGLSQIKPQAPLLLVSVLLSARFRSIGRTVRAEASANLCRWSGRQPRPVHPQTGKRAAGHRQQHRKVGIPPSNDWHTQRCKPRLRSFYRWTAELQLYDLLSAPFLSHSAAPRQICSKRMQHPLCFTAR